MSLHEACYQITGERAAGETNYRVIASVLNRSREERCKVDTRVVRAFIGAVLSLFASTIAVAIWFYVFLPLGPCLDLNQVHFGTPPPPRVCHDYNGVPYASFWDCLDVAPSYVIYFIGGFIGIIAGAISGKLY